MSVPSFDHNTPEEVAAWIKAELARNFSRLPTEELARLGQLYNAADEMLTLNLPHAVLIIDPQDPDRHFNLLGPFDTPLDAAIVAEDFLQMFDYVEDLQVLIIPLRPMTPTSLSGT